MHLDKAPTIDVYLGVACGVCWSGLWMPWTWPGASVLAAP